MSFTKEAPDIEEPEQSRGDWQLDCEASPDSLEQVDELLFSHTQMTPVPVVVAVKYEDSNDQKVVGVSYVDATTKLLGVSEFLCGNFLTKY